MKLPRRIIQGLTPAGYVWTAYFATVLAIIATVCTSADVSAQTVLTTKNFWCDADHLARGAWTNFSGGADSYFCGDGAGNYVAGAAQAASGLTALTLSAQAPTGAQGLASHQNDVGGGFAYRISQVDSWVATSGSWGAGGVAPVDPPPAAGTATLTDVWKLLALLGNIALWSLGLIIGWRLAVNPAPSLMD